MEGGQGKPHRQDLLEQFYKAQGASDSLLAEGHAGVEPRFSRYALLDAAVAAFAGEAG
jgi:hypothetical protein